MKILFIAPVGNSTYLKDDNPAIHGGYGNAALSTFYIFSQMKKYGLISQIDCIDTTQQDIKKEILDTEYDIAIIMSSISQFVSDKKIQFKFKNLLSLAKKRYYHILWETEPFPERFNSLFNDDFFTGYTAPSKWGVNCIKQKTNKPAYYTPYYISEQDWDLINIEDKLKNEKTFNVFYIGQYTIRKGTQDAIISFCRELGDKSDCNLTLKLTPASQHEQSSFSYLKSLINLNQTKLQADISYTDENIDRKTLIDIYKSSSLLFFPSRGEGFGYPAVEAMIQGLPVIYNNFSALTDVAESPYNIAVDCFLDEAHGMSIYGYDKNCMYGVSKIKDLMIALDKMYMKWKNNKEQYYLDAQKNREIIYNKFSIKPCVENYVKLIQGK